MRVAIFGGTGFVGGYIVGALLNAGHEPSVLVRRGSEHKLRQAQNCSTVSGDLSSTSAIEATLEDCDSVIYCVGILREIRRSGISFENLQFGGVVRVSDAAKRTGIRRFLLMSANGVKSSGTPYQETKYRAEQVVKAAGFDFTIFRPSVIFGDPLGKMEIATQLYRDMVAPPIPAAGFFSSRDPAHSTIRMSPVHVEDVAAAFVRALEDDATVGETYELGGPEELDWIEMIRRVASATGRKKWILPMPVGVMKFAATLFDWLPFFPVTRDQLTMLSEGNTVDSSKLESLIGKPPAAFAPEHLAYLGR